MTIKVEELNIYSEIGDLEHNLSGNLLLDFSESREDFFVMNEPLTFTFEIRSPYNANQMIRSIVDLCIRKSSCSFGLSKS